MLPPPKNSGLDRIRLSRRRNDEFFSGTGKSINGMRSKSRNKNNNKNKGKKMGNREQPAPTSSDQ
jgi:hypothetical protein